jgi:beta-N-acetylhexosaminidase
MRQTTMIVSCLAVFAAFAAINQPESPAQGGAVAQRLTAPHDEAERWALSTLRSLALEAKVSQMVCEQIRGGYVSESDDQYQYWLKLAREYGIGGFVVYGGTPMETASLLNRLQKAARIPLLVSADFEGGPGQQMVGASEFPANMALSATRSAELAYEVGRAGAVEGRAVGIHLTYSPVVDIQTRPDNPGLSVRSFGGDLELLGRMVSAYIKGYQDNGMLATAKHYPGRGEVELIPGTEFTINRKPADRVEQEDLQAFRKAIEAGVTFVMSEHIAVPALTGGSDLPASVDRTLATDWLRGKLGFKGVLTSDDLWYPKVSDRFGAERAGVMAIKAGHDVLLKPADAIKMIKAVVAAVKAGEISEARLDDSVRRLLYWKARLNLHRNRFVDLDRIPSVVGAKTHQDLVRRIADDSVTLLINKGVLPFKRDAIGKVLHVLIQKNENDAAPTAVAARMQALLPGARVFQFRPGADPDLFQRAVQAAREADTVIVSLFYQRTVYKDNGPLPAAERRLVEDLCRAKPRSTVVMTYGNPYLVTSTPEAPAFVVGYGEGGFYGNQLIYVESFFRLVTGALAPKGLLPVRVSDDFPIGAGIRY